MLAGALLLAACGELQTEVPSASQRPVEVTVDQSGTVTAVKPGATVILARAGEFSASCSVTVQAAE